MNNETKKIAISCFIGGVIGTIIGLLSARYISKMFLWIGPLAGFAAGYLAYEFKEVLKQAPIAWAKAKADSRKKWAKRNMAVIKWSKEYHPQIRIWIGVILVAITFSMICLISEKTVSNELLMAPVFLIMATVFGLVFGSVAMLFLVGLVYVGSTNFSKTFACGYPCDELKMKLVKKGRKETKMSYKNFAAWALRGLLLLIPLAFLALLKEARKEWLSTWDFTVKLFKAIHSSKRLICGIDSAIGTIIAIGCGIFLGNFSLPAILMLGACGGIFGAVLGVINYDIVSKKVLKIEPA